MDVIRNINKYYIREYPHVLYSIEQTVSKVKYGVVLLACDEPCVLCCDEATASRLGNITTSHNYTSSCLIYTYPASVLKYRYFFDCRLSLTIAALN